MLAWIAARHTEALVLSDRDVTSLYIHARTGDWRAMGEGERGFADAAIVALVETLFATASGRPVTSSGGLWVTPNLAVADFDVAASRCLGREQRLDLGPAQRAGRRRCAPEGAAAGTVVASICDGTFGAGARGSCGRHRHTLNPPDNLTPTGYEGGARCRDQPQALLDDRNVTALGAALVTFIGAVLEAIGLRSPDLDT